MVEALGILKNSFSSLKSDVGKKIVGIFFVIQLLHFGGTILTQQNLTLAGLSVTVIAAVLSIVGTIGGLRAFREGELKREMFTENILATIGRILGANLTNAVFAYGAAMLLLAPAVYLAALSGITAVSGISGASAGVIAAIGIGGILGIVVAAYIAVVLLLAQPLIAIDGKRMFQALDESIQRTKGARLSIFLALTILFLGYTVVAALTAIAGGMASEMVAGAATTLVVAPLLTSVSLCLLNYLTEELPEAE